MPRVCLNNARWHPIGMGFLQAINAYSSRLPRPAGGGGDADYGGGLQDRARELFAKLIHARPNEVSFVPSTTVATRIWRRRPRFARADRDRR